MKLALKEIVFASVYFILLIIVVAIGLIIAVGLGFDYPTLLFKIGPVELIGLPFSYVIFGIFGILLFFKFRWKAIFMLAFSYAAWEIVPQIAQSIVAPNTGGGNPFYLAVWSGIVFISLYVVKPRVDFTHWASILLFVYYAEIPWLQLYSFQLPSHPVFLVELFEEIIWLTMVWKSFYPENSSRGKLIREIFMGEKKPKSIPGSRTRNDSEDFVTAPNPDQKITVNETAALVCEPR